jgi:hypothetical protein
MNLIIDLTPSEQAQLSSAAKETGLAPAELVKKLVQDHLLTVPISQEDDLDAKLRRWQQQDSTKLTPDVPAQTLFAQWAEEDAHMTDEERAQNERIYAEIEKNGIPRVRM